MDVLTPRSLDEALRLKAEQPEAWPIQGGTDVMVELNFDRARPPALLNLNEVAELRGWSRRDGSIWLGAALTYTEAMQPPLAELLPALAEASRTVGGPQIRNRGTVGGNLGTASPAGDALPPLLIGDAEIELASVRANRSGGAADSIIPPAPALASNVSTWPRSPPSSCSTESRPRGVESTWAKLSVVRARPALRPVVPNISARP